MSKPSFYRKGVFALLIAVLALALPLSSQTASAAKAAPATNKKTVVAKKSVKASTAKKSSSKKKAAPKKKTKSSKIKVGKEPLLAAPLLQPDPLYYSKKGL